MKTKALISFAVTEKLTAALLSPMQIVGFLMQWLIYIIKERFYFVNFSLESPLEE